jgi:hypothetical protein
MKELDVGLMERYLEHQNIFLIALVIIGDTLPYNKHIFFELI